MRHILVVDDNSSNLKSIADTLTGIYKVTPVTSGLLALRFLNTQQPDLILLDLTMPEIDGLETLDELRRIEGCEDIPVIFLTSDTNRVMEAECLRRGAADFVVKPFAIETMLTRIEKTFMLEDYQKNLEELVRKKTEQIESLTTQAITAIANTIDAKDTYTKGHSVRVAKYASEIARRLKWSEENRRLLYFSALLHDIGKIGIPDPILNKTGSLTDEEYSLIKKHTIIGADILKDITLIPGVCDGARSHHERFDGKGYNDGLTSEKIPITARIIGIADAYDAMTSNRSYRRSLPAPVVRQELEKGRGTQFDPDLVDIMLGIMNENITFSSESIETFDSSDMACESNILLQKVFVEYQKEMLISAGHDSLTGLWNRSYTEQYINQHLSDPTAYGALFMIDLDEFKNLNDSFGHIMGDELLSKLACILLDVGGEHAIAGRIGGDEFILFIKQIKSSQDCVKVADRILSLMEKTLHKPDGSGSISASIGISLAPQDGSDFQALYKNADKSLYLVKNKGKNDYHFYADIHNGPIMQNEVNTLADLTLLRQMFTEPITKGAYQVGYDNFEKIYQFISRCIERTHQKVQLLLFTLTDEKGGLIEPEALDEAVMHLGQSIVYSLRRADVAMEYSSTQYIVILMDASQENGKLVAGRILSEFSKRNGKTDISLHYDIQELSVHQ